MIQSLDEAPQLLDQFPEMTSIKLDRLDETAVQALCASMLGERGIRDEVVQTIQRNSEGNTFFITETVRALAEEHGSLEKVATVELPQVVFTGSMQELMQRRLSKVDAEYREIQSLAAIIGREIDTRLLAHTYDDETVQAWLNKAAGAAVVNIQDNTWRFTHDKLRETILVDLTEDKKPALHRTAAEATEAVYPEDHAYNEALLNHWHKAGDFDKELYYLDAVAQQMIEIQGTHEAARNLLQHALARMGAEDGRQVSLLNWLAESYCSQSNYDASRDYAERARQLATQIDKQAELARSLTNLGMIADNQGQYADSADLYQKSLAHYQQLGDQRGIASSLNNLGRLADKQGDFTRATNLLQQSLALSQQLGDQRGIAKSLNNLGIIAIDRGEYDHARDLLQQSVAIKQQLGDQLGISMSLSNLGMVAENQGAYDRAMDLYKRALALSQEIGDQIGICYGFVYFGGIAFKQKDGQAARWFSRGLRIAHSMQATSEALWAVVGFAGVIAQDGQAERAAHYVGLAQHHPAQENNTRKVVAEIMPLLEAALSPEDLAAAMEHGKSLDLDTVVAELLEEFDKAEA